MSPRVPLSLRLPTDGSLVLTASSDGTARAFEMERGQCLRVLAGHTASVNALAMDPWARFIVTASSDGTARVWDLSSARSIHVLRTGCSEEQGETLLWLLAGAAASARLLHLLAYLPASPTSLSTLVPLCSLPAGGALCVALSPCTRFAILGLANRTARMYDVISGEWSRVS